MSVSYTYPQCILKKQQDTTSFRGLQLGNRIQIGYMNPVGYTLDTLRIHKDTQDTQCKKHPKLV